VLKQGVRRGLVKTGMTPPYRTIARAPRGRSGRNLCRIFLAGWRGIRMVAFRMDPL
jgi:hypothetical protein